MDHNVCMEGEGEGGGNRRRLFLEKKRTSLTSKNRASGRLCVFHNVPGAPECSTSVLQWRSTVGCANHPSPG